MIRERSHFRRSINDLRNGDDAAIWDLIEEYGPHIKRVIRRRLDKRMRSKFDSIDFVQMVWASFFKHPSQIVEFNEPADLLRYLSGIARNKVVSEHRRRMQYIKHNVKRERSLSRSKSLSDNRESPSQVAMAREKWEQIMSQQSDRDRSIVKLRITGATFEQIGLELGINERTARKVIDDIVERHGE